jgi:hypothetical protein
MNRNVSINANAAMTDAPEGHAWPTYLMKAYPGGTGPATDAVSLGIADAEFPPERSWSTPTSC